MLSIEIFLLASAFSLSAFFTGLMRIYARRANLLDVPNRRSSHQIATPRGGGLAVVIVFLGAVASLYALGKLPAAMLSAFWVGGLLIAGVGFIDDHRDLSARTRFSVQLIAATFAVVVLGGGAEIQIGTRLFDLGIFGDMLAIIFLVWFINLYNFMDGIDGLASAEALSIAISALIVSTTDSNEITSSLLAIIAGSALGFLVWNWPPAKIFMGDVGSGFFGFIIAVLAIISSNQGGLSIWCWLILAGVFVVDATITLVTRFIQGEQWYSAHKSHAYQKASRLLSSHRPVTLIVLMINLCWLLPIAWFASDRPESGWWLTLVAWIPLAILSMLLKAGRPDAGSLST